LDRLTILKPTRCDLKRLPLDAREAFILSQLDGQLTLDDLAQVAGLDFIEAARLARKLVELGAVTVLDDGGGASSSSSSSAKKRKLQANVTIVEKDERTTRVIDPRAERMSLPRMERVSVSIRPSSAGSTQPPKKSSLPPARRVSRKMRAVVVVEDNVCELDEAKQAEILALDAKLEKADFYVALDVSRDAEKKTIKRAYFALAAKFHPDRFFGKKLGKLKPAIDRVFRKLTLANDTLLNVDARAKYDATLPPAPMPPRTSKVPPRSSKAPSMPVSASKPPPSRSSKAPPTPRSTTKAPPRKPSRATRLSTRKMKKLSTKAAAQAAQAVAAQAAAVAATGTGTTGTPQRSEARLKQLHQAAREAKLQGRIDMFLQAAEEALRTDDVIGAANNYRLALEHREDMYVRSKLDEVDARARTVRLTRALTLGRTAEREQRWSDAAMHYLRGYDARPNAEIAERAGNALLRSNGDLEKAATLVEKSIELEPNNLGYHITLGEIYLTSNRLDDAEEEAEAALELSASDARAKALAAAVAKKQKSARR
jgi:tetratricopeptide (TPR) repeat protein